MSRCKVCGNDYDKCFEVVLEGRSQTFDCFECAIHALAPRCGRCGCVIVGHGNEGGGGMYCSAHCAHLAGLVAVRDRV